MWQHITLFLAIIVGADVVQGAGHIGLNGKNISLETWVAPYETAAKFPYYVSGFDNDNRPIYVMEMGKWDLRSAVEAGGKELENLQTHIDQFFWRVAQGGKNLPHGDAHPTDDVAVIVDWENYSLLQLAHGPTVQFFLKNIAGFQRIQEVIAYGFYVNANSVASTLINLARPVLGSALERVEIYGTQKDRWVPKLLRKFPKNQIPPWYGGEENFTPVQIFG